MDNHFIPIVAVGGVSYSVLAPLMSTCDSSSLHIPNPQIRVHSVKFLVSICLRVNGVYVSLTPF